MIVNKISDMKRSKLGELEALRGIAACSVVLDHFYNSFTRPHELPSRYEKIISVLTNGNAAVVLFFVLSGFVLPLSFFRSGADVRVITVAALHRLPRLVVLVFLTIMGSYLITIAGCNFAIQASTISGSSWFSVTGFPLPTEHFDPNFSTALWQGTIGALLDNKAEFNVSLWTMHHELYGSFVTLGLAFFLYKASARATLCISVAALVFLQYTAWRLSPFVIGIAISSILYQKPHISLRFPFAICLIALGFFLFGFHPDDSQYLPEIFDALGDNDQKAWFISIVAGAAFIIGVTGNSRIRAAMNAKWLVALGRHSFAMYAVHMLLMSSLVSWVFLHVYFLGKITAFVIITVVFIVTLAFSSFILTKIDEWCSKRTKKLVKKLLGFNAP